MKIVAAVGVAVCLVVAVIHVEGNALFDHNTEQEKSGNLMNPMDNVKLQRREFDRSTCEQKYLDLSETHTMCLVDVGVEIELTTADKAAIIQKHNDYRSSIQDAKKMYKAIWDDDLAVIAGKWARQCKLDHDKSNDRLTPGNPPPPHRLLFPMSSKGSFICTFPQTGQHIPRPLMNQLWTTELPGIKIGQNLAAHSSSPTFSDMIKSWHNEVKDYHYDVKTKQNGHYTQIIYADVTRIGCGSAYCENAYYKRFYVCNYAKAQMSNVKTYENGNSCSLCPDSCSDNLCDCNGKICFNMGTLDPNTCTCSCPQYVSGDQCEIVDCNAPDSSPCGSSFPQSYCATFANVPYLCRHMCGMC